MSWFLLCVWVVWLAGGGVVQAGMPSFALHEVASARLEVISFFLIGFLVMGLVVKWSWNSLAAVVEVMPALAYRRALALVLLSGLVMYVVLTMVSGARELMTPGAWERADGRVTYELAGSEVGDGAGDVVSPDGGREPAMRRLYLELVRRAAVDGGRFPNSRELSGIAEEVWEVPRGGDAVAYVGSLTMDSPGGRVLAYESEAVGGRVVVLRVDGGIEAVAVGDLERRLRAEVRGAFDPGGEDVGDGE